MVKLSQSICLSILFLCFPVFSEDLSTGLTSESSEFHICTDINSWYPFTFEENGESKGLHVDIVKLACKKESLECKFQPLPWKRCLLSVKNGRVDAVVSASYSIERSDYLDYPPGVKLDYKSPWRITQSEYVVITLTNNDYEFSGDLSTLPAPVIAPSGYSIIKYLEGEGVKVTGYSKNITMFKTLVRTKEGTAISLAPIPAFIEGSNVFADKLKIHGQPILSKSYFVAISKNTKIPYNLKLLLWKSIVAIREDKRLFHRLAEQYQH